MAKTYTVISKKILVGIPSGNAPRLFSLEPDAGQAYQDTLFDVPLYTSLKSSFNCAMDHAYLGTLVGRNRKHTTSPDNESRICVQPSHVISVRGQKLKKNVDIGVPVRTACLALNIRGRPTSTRVLKLNTPTSFQLPHACPCCPHTHSLRSRKTSLK